MDKSNFTYPDDQRHEGGLWGNDVFKSAVDAIKTMRDYPELMKLPLFILQCMKWAVVLPPSPPPLLDPQCLVTRLPLSPYLVSRAMPMVTPYTSDEYERTAYYNRITSNNDHPILVYRLDFSTISPKPNNISSYIPVKETRRVSSTLLNKVWDVVGPQIKDLNKAQGVDWSPIDVAHFFTHVSDKNATHHVRRFLTALYGTPLAAEEMKVEDAQGTLTLWFHENWDKNGNPSDKVYGLTNFLRKDTTVKYRHRSSAPKDHVRVCRTRRFQRGIDEVTKANSDQGILVQYYTGRLADLQSKETSDVEAVQANQRGLESANKSATDLGGIDTEGGALYTSD